MKKLFTWFCLFCYCTVGNTQNIFEKNYIKPEATEVWKPMPQIVTPGKDNAPPSDAIVLFNGKNLNNWVMSKDDQPCQWNIDNGKMITKLGSGNIKTKQKFGNCQLHIEFMLPPDIKKRYEHNNAGNKWSIYAGTLRNTNIRFL
jgi:hypothetical protein